MTHTQRWRHHRRLVGEGPLYQRSGIGRLPRDGRFKCFPVQAEGHDGCGHLLSLLRYVERNPLRAGLVRRAEDWPWSSLHARLNPSSPGARLVRLHPWPVERPSDWVEWVKSRRRMRNWSGCGPACGGAGRSGTNAGSNGRPPTWAWRQACGPRAAPVNDLRTRCRRENRLPSLFPFLFPFPSLFPFPGMPWKRPGHPVRLVVIEAERAPGAAAAAASPPGRATAAPLAFHRSLMYLWPYYLSISRRSAC